MEIKAGLKQAAKALSIFFGIGIASFVVSATMTSRNAQAMEKAITPGMSWSEVAVALDSNRQWEMFSFHDPNDGCGMVHQEDGKYSFSPASPKASDIVLANLTDEVLIKQAASCSRLTIFFMGVGGYAALSVKLSSASVVSVGSVNYGP